MDCPRCGTRMQGGICPECGFPVLRKRSNAMKITLRKYEKGERKRAT